jgi:hypothetical protein
MASLDHFILLLKRNRLNIVVAIATVITFLFSRSSSFVEYGYANGFFRVWVKGIPKATSFIPFSVGDLFYLFSFFYLGYRLFYFIKRKSDSSAESKWKRFFLLARKSLKYVLVIYLIFLWIWGLHYFRSDVSVACKVNKSVYSKAELIRLNQNLIMKMKAFRPERSIEFKEMNESARKAYVSCGLIADRQSERLLVKKSVFSKGIAYLGISGYYNPFTGEAQIDGSYPMAMKSFVTAHEMAHQLGYAREDDANFLAFLASENSKDSALIYATQLQMFIYANGALYDCDSLTAKSIRRTMPVEAKGDIKSLFNYYNSKKNPIEPIATKLYGWFLKSHRQPQGMVTYSEVLSLVMDYYRKNKWNYR